MTHPHWRGILAGLGAILALTALLAALSLHLVTARPGAPEGWLHTPAVFGRGYSLGLLPCTAAEPGSLFIGPDVRRISSGRLPPGLRLPTAPPCP